MHSIYSLIILAVCCLQTTLARPTVTSREAKPWSSGSGSNMDADISSTISSLLQDCSDYDLSQAELPTAPTPLPKPTGTLSHIAIGRGYQNYTCDLSNSTAVPVPIGAVATLYNMSCVAARSPTLQAYLPSLVYALRVRSLPHFKTDGVSTSSSSDSSSSMTTSFFQTLVTQFEGSSPETFVVNAGNALMSGHHFFVDATTPRFDLDTANGQLGTVTVSKVGVSDAPSTAAKGSVAWLYLPASKNWTSTTQSYSAVYRVNTVGGSPPATCKEVGKDVFRRSYAAEYWFYK